MSSSDEDVGPMPATSAKKRKLQHEALFLNNIPAADSYEVSLMHRDLVSHVVVIPNTDFIVTASIDGHIKFWKKMGGGNGVEFVKHFRAHTSPIVAIDSNSAGTLLASIAGVAGNGGSCKIFDVVNFDMINMFQLDYLPSCVCWIKKSGSGDALVAVADHESSSVHVYNGREGIAAAKVVAPSALSIRLMRYNPEADVVVSIDSGGMIEYWRLDDDAETGYCTPAFGHGVSFNFKGETDLYEFKKSKTLPTSLTFSPQFDKFATFGFDDRMIRIFSFKTGKMIRKYDEGIIKVTEMHQNGTEMLKLDDMEFG